MRSVKGQYGHMTHGCILLKQKMFISDSQISIRKQKEKKKKCVWRTEIKTFTYFNKLLDFVENHARNDFYKL